MSRDYIPKALRERVAAQAGHRCGYCLTSSLLAGSPFEHFAWSDAGDRIVGLTPTGRATVVALQLNRPILVHARRAWTSVGWHPPGC